MEPAPRAARVGGEQLVIDAIYEIRRRHCTMCLTCLDELVRAAMRAMSRAVVDRTSDCALMVREAAKEIGHAKDPQKYLLELARRIEGIRP